MRRVGGTFIRGGVIAAVAACGGEPFAPGSGDDASMGGASESDSGGQVVLLADVASSDAWFPGDAAPQHEGGPADDSSLGRPDGSMDAAFFDAGGLSDVLEEPPPHCGGVFACAPEVPNGWSGPLELYAGSTSPSGCTANFMGPVYSGKDVLSAMPAACGCQCQSPPCSSPMLSLYSGTTCVTGSSNYCSSIYLTPGACSTIDVLSACPDAGSSTPRTSMSAASSTAATCTPMLSVTKQPVTWGTSAVACASSAGPAQSDCGSASICAPLPAAPFGGSLCVSQAGDVACPAIGYTVKHLFYGGLNDTRDCAPCTCGPVTNAACSATVNVFASSDHSCSGGAITYMLPSVCDAVQQPADFRLDLSAPNGTCAASAPTSIGTAAPTTPTTFCCTP